MPDNGVPLLQRQPKETDAEYNARRTRSLAEIDAKLLTLVHAGFQVAPPHYAQAAKPPACSCLPVRCVGQRM